MFSVMPTNSLFGGNKGKAGKGIKCGEEKKKSFSPVFLMVCLPLHISWDKIKLRIYFKKGRRNDHNNWGGIFFSTLVIKVKELSKID